MFLLCAIHTPAYIDITIKKIVNFRMLKGILMNSAFVEKVFCIYIVKFSVVKLIFFKEN